MYPERFLSPSKSEEAPAAGSAAGLSSAYLYRNGMMKSDGSEAQRVQVGR